MAETKTTKLPTYSVVFKAEINPADVVRLSMEKQKGDDNPSRVARNIVHALYAAGFRLVREA